MMTVIKPDDEMLQVIENIKRCQVTQQDDAPYEHCSHHKNCKGCDIYVSFERAWNILGSMEPEVING